MSFADQKHASGMIGALIAMLVIGLIVRVVWAGGFENYFIPGKALENEVVEQLETYPGNAVLLEQLEATFPREYEDFTDTLGRAARGPGDEDRVIEAGNRWIGEFFANHQNDFAAAPIADLDRVMELELAFLNSMRAHDEYACAA